MNMETKHLLSDINPHAPVERRSLADHLDSGDLTYRARSGHEVEISKEEIDILCGVCTEHERSSLRLPLIVMTDTSFTQSAWKVEGHVEVSVVSKLLSRKPLRDDLIHLYHPHLRELQKMLPNSVSVLFVP